MESTIYCVLCGCTKRDVPDRGFFYFPTGDRGEKWVEYTRLDDLKRKSPSELRQQLLCSAHFDPKSILLVGTKKGLLTPAIPSVEFDAALRLRVLKKNLYEDLENDNSFINTHRVEPALGVQPLFDPSQCLIKPQAGKGLGSRDKRKIYNFNTAEHAASSSSWWCREDEDEEGDGKVKKSTEEEEVSDDVMMQSPFVHYDHSYTSTLSNSKAEMINTEVTSVAAGPSTDVSYGRAKNSTLVSLITGLLHPIESASVSTPPTTDRKQSSKDKKLPFNDSKDLFVDSEKLRLVNELKVKRLEIRKLRVMNCRLKKRLEASKQKPMAKGDALRWLETVGLPTDTYNFIVGQIEAASCKTPGGRRYSNEIKAFGLEVYLTSPKVYNILKRTLLLPTKHTLLRMITSSKVVQETPSTTSP